MTPLAERMRPQSLDTYVGQQHLVGEGAVLRQAIERGKIPSFILWGPPGVGKTTLAQLIAKLLQKPFFQLSAINAGVKDIREAIESADKQNLFQQKGAILFIDEIHRFSKSQQDALLGAVEKGTVTLIGATTENPSFEVIPALLSRCQVYVLQHLTKDELIGLVDRALAEDEILKTQPIEIQEYDAMLLYSGGDARRLLNALELIANFSAPEMESGKPLVVTNDLVRELIQQNAALYDKTGEQHYDIISAFIKSMRGSDPNAAVYWLARMLDGGEDIEFIARRMVILASEDVGLANPNALLLATTTMDAIRMIGMPEARIILSQCAIYLATSPKSNASYMAIGNALQTVKQTGSLPVPLHLRNAPTKLMKELNYGSGYQYAHDFQGNFVQQANLPEAIDGTILYEPGANATEERVRAQLREQWKGKYKY
ncbi:MAG TPA: replication-associated recombination protein A [Saprospiraceae bacterium]|nr:replication-associated recombination protein A [Saprospiraceae bacterium]HPI08476.1 replication-associated recombination protein A [Saprospiraceae bacterium]